MNVVQKIIEKHLGKKRRVTREAKTMIYLHHITFLMKLADKCDNYAFRHRKMQINEDAVLECSPSLLASFYETGKIQSKARLTTASKYGKKQQMTSVDERQQSFFEDSEEELHGDSEGEDTE